MSQGTTKGVPIDIDPLLSANSDLLVPSQKAIKTYADNGLIGKVDRSGDTMSGYLILNADPTSPLGSATKQYVDNISAGINFHSPVNAATTTNLVATYFNGVSGFGATLTATSNGALVVDSQSMSANQRVLVWQQSSGIENGIYNVTDAGSPTTPFILTRSADADNVPPGEIIYGDFVLTLSGTLYGGFGFICNTPGTITIGVTSISYIQYNVAQAVSAGYGLQELTSNVLSVDTSVIASVSSLSSYLTIVSAAATYYPLTNPSGYISGITSGDVTTALGFTPYSNANPSGFITSAALSGYLTSATAASTYQPLDSDLTTIAGLTPADDDIIQRKAGAWTNRTIAQYYADLQPSVKDDVYFTIPFFPAVLSPADAATYYIGAGSIAPSTTATNQDISFGYNMTVIGAIIMASGNTASGTTENSTMSIRNTTTSTSSTIGTFQTNGSTTVVINTTITGLSINVDAAQSFCLQWLAPTWVTNPTAVAVRTILICKRR